MVAFAQHVVIALQDRLFLEGVGEVGLDPDLPDARQAVLAAAGGEPEIRLLELAGRRHRRVALEPIAERAVGNADHQFLGMLAQRELGRPVRIRGQELGEVAEHRAAARTRQVEPPEDFGQELVARPVGALAGTRPIAGMDHLEGGAIGLPVGLAELRPRGSCGQRQRHPQHQSTCEPPHRHHLQGARRQRSGVTNWSIVPERHPPTSFSAVARVARSRQLSVNAGRSVAGRRGRSYRRRCKWA